MELSQEIAAGIPGAKLEIVPDCGHLSTMERPEAVNRALRAWLTALIATPPAASAPAAPPMTPPRIGATQNSHSWLKAAVPPNKALPRLRAGLTEALEIGMAMMWIASQRRADGDRREARGARRLVAPMITNTRNAVSTVSIRNTGACRP